MLSIRGLNQSYGQSHTLWDIDLDIPQGGCVSLIGRNGVGKTTLLNTIMGLLPVDSGSMDYEGHSLLSCSAEDRARLGIGYVSPGANDLFPCSVWKKTSSPGLACCRPVSDNYPTISLSCSRFSRT